MPQSNVPIWVIGCIPTLGVGKIRETWASPHLAHTSSSKLKVQNRFKSLMLLHALVSLITELRIHIKGSNTAMEMKNQGSLPGELDPQDTQDEVM